MNNNFTTPEQSKRLSELGLPQDSADCYYVKFEIDSKYEKPIFIEDGLKYSDKAIHDLYYLPCWSVGRLIEIFVIIKMNGNENAYYPLQLFYDEITVGLAEFVVCLFENHNKEEKLDFQILNY